MDKDMFDKRMKELEGRLDLFSTNLSSVNAKLDKLSRLCVNHDWFFGSGDFDENGQFFTFLCKTCDKRRRVPKLDLQEDDLKLIAISDMDWYESLIKTLEVVNA